MDQHMISRWLWNSIVFDRVFVQVIAAGVLLKMWEIAAARAPVNPLGLSIPKRRRSLRRWGWWEAAVCSSFRFKFEMGGNSRRRANEYIVRPHHLASNWIWIWELLVDVQCMIEGMLHAMEKSLLLWLDRGTIEQYIVLTVRFPKLDSNFKMEQNLRRRSYEQQSQMQEHHRKT